MHVRISRTEPAGTAPARWTGQVTVTGPLPGDRWSTAGTRRQAAIVADELRLGHGSDNPDAIPLADLRAVSPVELPGGANAVAIRVARGDHEAALLVQPVISLLGRRGGRAAALLDALASWGVPVASHTAPPMLSDAAGSPWRPLDDTILWTGRASIPSHPWLPLQSAHVWVTTRALRWTIDGVGACSLPLDAITAAAATGGDRHPAEAAIEYETGGIRFVLTLRFDLYGPDRSARERGAFLVSIRSRGIRTQVGPAIQSVAAPAAATPHPLKSAAAAASGSPAPQRPALPQPAATGDLSTARAVEAALLDDLHRLNRALASGIPLRREDDLGARLGSGLADLDAAEQRATTPQGDITSRRTRMLALAEATTRLRALIDQRERGLLDGASIEHRRQAILAPLGVALLG